MEMTFRVAVTGAETPLGGRIVALLTEKQIPVIALIQDTAPSNSTWDKAVASGLLAVHPFDLLIGEDSLPSGDAPAILMHLATGRTPADHLAMARAARLLADHFAVKRLVYLSSLTGSHNSCEHLAHARRLAETIMHNGSAGETHVVRAGLLDEDIAAGTGSSSSIMRPSGWQRIAISDQEAIAQALIAAMDSENSVQEVAPRRHVRAWQL